MPRLLFLSLLMFASAAQAIVIRHDVDDAMYRVEASALPALADISHSGHGVLIAPRWVVTAAHTVAGDLQHVGVSIAGACRQVDRVVLHPGYRSIPAELYQGHSGPASRAQDARDDIALIRLAEPVPGVEPATLHSGDGEVGAWVRLLGKGATATGDIGLDHAASQRTELRQAYTHVAAVDARWIDSVFEAGEAAHPLQGMMGNGDSGGPMLMEVAPGDWHVIGLAAWTVYDGELADYRGGLYGQVSKHVRLSRYVDWIKQVVGEEAVESAEGG